MVLQERLFITWLPVTNGFYESSEVNGVGYRAAVEGKKLVLNLGYSHP